MTDNLRHWSALSRTDPKHTKPFQRAGGFRGTATRPIWIEMRLTEHFGPCGIGWGCDEPVFTLVPAADEILVFCTLACWYMDDDKRATVYGIGGDKVLVKQSSGLRADDEAYKKAFTDALCNAFKHVGSNADVHMGLFEDSKYKAEVAAEFAEGDAGKPVDARSANPPQQRAQSVNGHQAPTSARPFAEPATTGRDATSTDASRTPSHTGNGPTAPLPPPSPEEPPETAEARAAYTRLLKEFRSAANETAITAIWQANADLVVKIKRFGGDSAFNTLSIAAQKRLDALRQGAAA